MFDFAVFDGSCLMSMSMLGSPAVSSILRSVVCLFVCLFVNKYLPSQAETTAIARSELSAIYFPACVCEHGAANEAAARCAAARWPSAACE